MTERIKPVRLYGGPRDGQTYRPATRWPTYLDENCHTLPTDTGDRICRGSSARRGCYVRQVTTPTSQTLGYVWTEGWK
jgi:hypothetical protein